MTENWKPTHELRHRDKARNADDPPVLVMRVGHRAYTRQEWPEGPASYTIAKYSDWCWHGDSFVGSVRPVTDTGHTRG